MTARHCTVYNRELDFYIALQLWDCEIYIFRLTRMCVHWDDFLER